VGSFTRAGTQHCRCAYFALDLRLFGDLFAGMYGYVCMDVHRSVLFALSHVGLSWHCTLSCRYINQSHFLPIPVCGVQIVNHVGRGPRVQVGTGGRGSGGSVCPADALREEGR